MRKKCFNCDYCRCVVRCEELPQENKKVAREMLRRATVCINPHSSSYAECKDKKSKACSEYCDWYANNDYNGDVVTVRGVQAALVDNFRTERLAMPALGLPGLAPGA